MAAYPDVVLQVSDLTFAHLAGHRGEHRGRRPGRRGRSTRRPAPGSGTGTAAHHQIHQRAPDSGVPRPGQRPEEGPIRSHRRAPLGTPDHAVGTPEGEDRPTVCARQPSDVHALPRVAARRPGPGSRQDGACLGTRWVISGAGLGVRQWTVVMHIPPAVDSPELPSRTAVGVHATGARGPSSARPGDAVATARGTAD